MVVKRMLRLQSRAHQIGYFNDQVMTCVRNNLMSDIGTPLRKLGPNHRKLLVERTGKHQGWDAQ